MGSFSIWHWLVVLGLVAVIAIPLWFGTRRGKSAEGWVPGQFRDPTNLTRYVTWALFALMGMAILGLISGALERQFFYDVQNGLYRSNQAAIAAGEASDARQRVVGVLRLATYVVTAILVGTWIYRANVNARQLGAAGLAFTPGWAVGWYFIPVAGLWKPYQAMREIWCASRDPVQWRAVDPPASLGWWGGFWIVGNVLGQISFRMTSSVHSVSDGLIANGVTLFADCLDVPLCLLLLSIVRDVQANQMESATSRNAAVANAEGLPA